jgi:type I restriction enzyme S subunit
MTVPKLRFKEFGESWSQVILDDLADVERGKFSVRPRNDPRYFGGKMPFVQTGDVTGSDVYLKGFSQTLNEDGIKVSKVFPEDTILITIAANIGDTTITQYPVACPDSVVAIQPKKELTNTIFLKNIIDLKKDFLDSQATQNAQKNINLQILKPLELIVPCLKEQTQIASFLSAVDEKISQLIQKHELLNQYKQGMMQKLFSQQIRFKADDGSEFGEWEDSKLGELTTVITKGTTPSSLGEKFEESGINFIKIESLSSNGKFLLDKFAYIDENTHNKLARSKLEHDDILFSIAGALGRVAIISRDYLPANTNQALAIIRLKDKKITRYIYYFLNSDYVKKIIDAESVQLAQANFSLGQLANLDVLVPCLEEQTKISNFLSSIDQKIEVVAQQIEQAKQWKKGLLQQMFV